MIRYGITLKLTLAVVVTSSLVLGAVLSYIYVLSEDIVVQNKEAYARALSEGAVQQIESVVKAVESVPGAMVHALDSGQISTDELIALLPSIIENSPRIFGSTVAFEPYAYHSEIKDYAPYFYAGGTEVVRTSLVDSQTDFRQRSWYSLPKSEKRALWSEPYYDEGGGEILMTTYSVPSFAGDELRAIVTADVSLEWLRKIVGEIGIGQSGYTFLLSRNRTLLAHPDNDLIMAGPLLKSDDEPLSVYLAHLVRESHDTQSLNHRVEQDPYIGGTAHVLYSQNESTGWTIGVVFSRQELSADIRRMNQQTWIIAGVGVLLLLLLLLLLSRRMTGPLRALAHSTQSLGQGNLDTIVPDVSSRDEIGTLAESIAKMRDDLKSYIRELTETVAVRERMENELAIAKSIQLNMVPRDFSIFAHIANLTVYADLIPARGVGGDLYDLFEMDDHRLFFTLGDVSGKGVPAALLMARTVTLIRSLAGQMTDPSRILGFANRELEKNNDDCMFVTLICGILDYQSGEISYANAGHTDPVLLDYSGQAKLLPVPASLPLGLMDDTEYELQQARLEPGTMIVLYSDGITEAFDRDRNQYGEESLCQSVSRRPWSSSVDLVKSLISDVQEHARGVDPSDDIAVLVIHRLGSGPVVSGGIDSLDAQRSVRISNDRSDYARVLTELQSFCGDRSVAHERQQKLRLILEEAVTNIIRYAYPDGEQGIIDIAFNIEGNLFTITLCDDGKAFSPLTHEESGAHFDDRDRGGMGIRLLREMTDQMDYEYSEQRNCLTLGLKL